MKPLPNSKYCCQKCGRKFERGKPGQVVCSCGHIYVDWLNYKEVMEWLYENDPDYENRR